LDKSWEQCQDYVYSASESVSNIEWKVQIWGVLLKTTSVKLQTFLPK
jgi:hypothetical protein